MTKPEERLLDKDFLGSSYEGFAFCLSVYHEMASNVE